MDIRIEQNIPAKLISRASMSVPSSVHLFIPCRFAANTQYAANEEYRDHICLSQLAIHGCARDRPLVDQFLLNPPLLARLDVYLVDYDSRSLRLSFVFLFVLSLHCLSYSGVISSFLSRLRVRRFSQANDREQTEPLNRR